MSLFQRLEKRLGDMVEGLFSRTFKAPIHPIEMARRLRREMDDRKTISVSRVYAPNDFTVRLHPEDAAMLEGVRAALRDELSGFLADHAREQGYTLLGRPAVQLETDANVERGQIAVESRLVARDEPLEETRALEVDVSGDTKIYHLARETEAMLAVVEGPGAGAEIAVPPEGATIGRSDDNAVVLLDPQASRHHARIEPAEGGYVLVDLASTNGTAVNGGRVSRHRLSPGDRIAIGSTILEFRRA